MGGLTVSGGSRIKIQNEGTLDETGSFKYGPVKIKHKSGMKFIDKDGNVKSIRGRALRACPDPKGGPIFVKGNIMSQFSGASPVIEMPTPIKGKYTINFPLFLFDNWLYSEVALPKMPTPNFQFAQKGHKIRAIMYFAELGAFGPCP